MRIKAKTGGLLRTLPVAAVVACAFTGVALLVGTGALAVYYGNSNANNSNIHNSNITNSNFSNSTITDSNINNSTISNSNVETSNVNSSNVTNSNLFIANVSQSNLNNAGVFFSNVGSSDLTNNVLEDQNDCNNVVTSADLGSASSANPSTGDGGQPFTCVPLPPPPPVPANNANSANNSPAVIVIAGVPCLDSATIKGPFTNEPSPDGGFVFAAGAPGVYQICISNGIIYVSGPAGAVVTVAHSGSRLSTTITLTGGSANIAIAKVPS